jgi:hypothetical protein
MNSIMNLLGGGNGNIMMQAFGAMMRGESPQSFLNNLAKTNPALKGMDFSNLQQTAQKVCQDNNIDMESKINEIKSQLPS